MSQMKDGHLGSSLLEVNDLSVEFMTSLGPIPAVKDFTVSVARGESMAIVGESGSGKSVSMRAVLQLFPTGKRVRMGGTIRFDGVEIAQLPAKEMRAIRGDRIAFIAQDALSSLNPSLTIGYQIAEALRIHRGWNVARCRQRAVELLDMVGIPSARDRLKDYPHQFSGGMRQRALIAIGLALDPDVLIADEPTTALDVTIQAQILQLLRELREETGMTLVLITHDMGVVAEIADRVTVMYAGSTVESGPVRDVFASPCHPYTEGLLRAVPGSDHRAKRLTPIPGSPPSPSAWPSGCPFHPRCPYARDECSVEPVSLESASATHQTSCRFWKENLRVRN